MSPRLVSLLGLAGAAVVLRRDLLVRAIRVLDRRGGLFARRGQRAYAATAGVFSGLHRRAAADAARAVGSRDATVVDIGSGPGQLLADLRERAPAARLVGVEPSATMRAIAAERGIIALEGRAEHLPFPAASADLVVSTLSCHHWDDVAAAFAEICRVLRPGGEARIYDVRFAGYGPGEARALARAARIDPDTVQHRVLDERVFGLCPYALITIRP